MHCVHWEWITLILLFNWYDVAYDALYRMSLFILHAMCIVCVDVPCNYIWHLSQWIHCVHWEWINLILLFNWYDVAYDAIYRMSLFILHAICILCVDVPCNCIWHQSQWMHCVHWEWITLISLFNWYDVLQDALYRMSLSNFHAICIVCVDVPCKHI